MVFHVIIVDDNAAQGNLTKVAILEHHVDCAITIFTDAEQLILYLSEKAAVNDLPDLVLLDLKLPRVSGKEALAAIKLNDRLKHLPIIMLTGSSNNIDVLDCLNLYANAFVVKPVDFDAFVNVMSSIVHFSKNIAARPAKEGFTIADPDKLRGDKNSLSNGN